MSELKASCRDIKFRISEKKLRPKKLDELKDVLNKSAGFLMHAKNLTGEDLPLTETEWNSLDKLINTTKVKQFFYDHKSIHRKFIFSHRIHKKSFFFIELIFYFILKINSLFKSLNS